MREREQMQLLQRPLFQETTPKKPLVVEEDVEDDDEPEVLLQIIPKATKKSKEHKHEEHRATEPVPVEPPKTNTTITATTSSDVKPMAIEKTTETVVPQPATHLIVVPSSPKVMISSSGDLNWTPWYLIKNINYVFVNAMPSSPAIFEIGFALQELGKDHNPTTIPTRDRIRVTNIKYLGSTSNLKNTITSLCNDSSDPLNHHIIAGLKNNYDVYVHLFPMRTKGSADRVQNNILNSFCYEWNDQERSRGSLVRGKVYYPQPIEVDDEVLDQLEKLQVTK